MSNQASRTARRRASSLARTSALPAARPTAKSRRRTSAPKRPRRGSEGTAILLPVAVPSTKPVIYVMAIEGTPDSAGFGLSPDGPFAEGGVVFVFAKQLQATVTWVLGAGIADLTSPNIEFSSVQGGEQMLTIASLPTEAESIPFFVQFNSGALHDPQIVITPIGGGVPPRPVKPRRAKAGAAKRAPAKRPTAVKTPVKKAPRTVAVASKAKAKAKAKRVGARTR